MEAIDYNTILNYSKSLSGTLKHIVDHQDSQGKTILHIAVMQIDKMPVYEEFEKQRRREAIQIVKVLASIDIQADPYLRNNQGNSAIDYAENIFDF